MSSFCVRLRIAGESATFQRNKSPRRVGQMRNERTQTGSWLLLLNR
jgi:hypothetical protein